MPSSVLTATDYLQRSALPAPRPPGAGLVVVVITALAQRGTDNDDHSTPWLTSCKVCEGAIKRSSLDTQVQYTGFERPPPPPIPLPRAFPDANTVGVTDHHPPLRAPCPQSSHTKQSIATCGKTTIERPIASSYRNKIKKSQTDRHTDR